MLSPENIAEAARRLIAEAGKPVKVILFGSYARGEADDASDLDLMVVDMICRTRGLNTSASRVPLAVWVLASISCCCPNRNSNVAAKCREPQPTGRKKTEKCFMTPQREEAERFLRLARRDQAASVVLRKLRYMHHWTHLPHPLLPERPEGHKGEGWDEGGVGVRKTRLQCSAA